MTDTNPLKNSSAFSSNTSPNTDIQQHTISIKVPDNLDPLDRLQTMEKYAQYIGAKLKAIDLDADITQTGTTAIETTLRNLIQLPDP